MTRASTKATTRARLPLTVCGFHRTSVGSNGAAKACVIDCTSAPEGRPLLLLFAIVSSRVFPPSTSVAGHGKLYTKSGGKKRVAGEGMEMGVRRWEEKK